MAQTLRLFAMFATSRAFLSPQTSHRLISTKILASYFTIFYNDVYHVPLPPAHRFPMEKYGKVRRRIQDHVRETENGHVTFHKSPLVTVDELETTHCPNYMQRFLQGDMTEEENRNVGFPWSPAGVDRALSSVGGTLAAARVAVSGQWAAHVAGGTHHAFYDRGEGFCVFSDMAVAANVILKETNMTSILLLDLDVHQGNGNAVLFQNDNRVTTVSLHCRQNYFSEKQKSDLDLELPAGCTDSTYLATLHHWLRELAKNPFDIIFFQAGVDILQEDRLGRMDITQQGLQRRNEMVYQFAWDMQVPFVICMGGGYPRDDWEPILRAHTSVYTQACDFLAAKVESQQGED